VFGGTPYLVVTSAVSAPGPAPILGASTSSATSAATISPASSVGPVPIIVGSLSVHVDWFVVFGVVGGGLVPSREVVVWALASGVILARAGTAVVRVPGVRGAIELVGPATEEGDPLIVGVAVMGWGGGVHIKEGNRGASLSNLEGDDI